MPLDNEYGSPVEPVETLQTETVEKESAPTLTEAQEPDGEKPEGESVKEPEEKPTIPKGVQKRIDRLTREKHQMREELEALRRAQQSANGGESERISRDQFDTEDEYLDAVIELRQAKREAQTRAAQWDEKRATILEKAEDSGIDLDEFSKLPVSRFMADAIVDSDVSVQLVAYMTENPAEVKRIYSLSEARQAVEIGKIEARLSEDQPRKTAKTAAPAPIKPLSGNGVSSGGYRKDMSLTEYAKWRRSNK